jgi:hypothetical protein
LCAAGVASAGELTPNGAPVGAVSPAPEAGAIVVDRSVDDAGLPLSAEGLAVDASLIFEVVDEDGAERGEYTGAGPLPATSTMTVELGSDASAQARALAAQAENAWSRGDVAGMENALSMIRSMGEAAAPTFSYDTPLAVSASSFTDSQVKLVNSDEFELNVDTATGNLFVLIREPNDWTVHISTDDGQTWSQVFSFNGDAEHVDLMVVDGFGYVWSAADDQARLRRFDASTGAVDVGFGFQVVFDAGVGTMLDIAVEGNQDSVFDNRIYVAVIESDNTLRWAFATTSDPTTFFEDSANGITNAGGNLDMHWDTALTNNYVHFCYTTTSNQIRHAAINTLGWSATTFIDTYTDGPVRVAAYDDAVIIAFNSSGSPTDARYWISYNDGGIFASLSLSQNTAAPADNVDVAARFGYGTAVTFSAEEGEPDPLYLQRRPFYGPGAWNAEVQVNGVDVQTGNVNRIEALPPISSGATYSYGLLYVGRPFGLVIGVYFTRVEDCAWLGDTDGDGDVELDDLLLVLANFGTFTADGDTDGNQFVELADLLTVLADFGNDCSGI